MSEARLVVRVEGIDAADSSESALELRRLLRAAAAVNGAPGISIKMSKSDPHAMDANGDILQIFAALAASQALIVETLKSWVELNRGRTLVVETAGGASFRVDHRTRDLAQLVQAFAPVAAPAEPE